MRRTVRCFAASACVASLVSRAALSAPPAELNWQAPRGCPGREDVLSEVSRLVATAPAEPLRARALVRKKRESYEVRIEIAGAAHGVRTLHAQTCESLARATALIIALAIDPQAAAVVSEQPEGRVQSESPVLEASTPEADAQRLVRDAPAPSARPLVFLGFFGERALVPGLALGAEAGIGLGWRFLRSDIAGGVIPRASASLAENPAVSGEFTLAFVALRGCGGMVDESVSVSGCMAIRGARIWARGEGASPSIDRTAHALALEPGVLLRVPGASGVGAELTANLVLPLIRPQFVIAEGETQRELFRPPALGAVVKLALGYEF